MDARRSELDILILCIPQTLPLDDPSTPAGSLWHRAFTARRHDDESHAGGWRTCYWGRSIETADIILVLLSWGTSDLTDTIFLSHAHSSIANELSPLLLATPRLVTFSPVNGYVTHLYGPEETPVINTVTLWKFPAELSRRERIEVRYLFYDEGYALQPRCDMWKHGCNGWKGGWVRSDQVFVEGALDDGSSTEVQAEREKDDANKNLGDHEDLILNGNDSVRAWLSVGAWKKPGNREKWEESDEWKVLQKRWEEKAFLGRETWTVKFKQLATSASGSKAQ